MMRVIKTEDQGTLCCFHWRNWPPVEAVNFPDKGAEELRSMKILGPVEAQRFTVWERECGLLEMNEGRCLSCKHVRKLIVRPPQVPMLQSLDGKQRVPLVDSSFVACLPTFRRRSRLKGRRMASEET